MNGEINLTIGFGITMQILEHLKTVPETERNCLQFQCYILSLSKGLQLLSVLQLSREELERIHRQMLREHLQYCRGCFQCYILSLSKGLQLLSVLQLSREKLECIHRQMLWEHLQCYTFSLCCSRVERN